MKMYMKECNKVFFGEHGLTSTSANHLANIASEKMQEVKIKIDSAQFYSSQIALVGGVSDTPKVISTGVTEHFIKYLDGDMEFLGDMTAFISWAREAIKAKEYELEYVQDLSFQDWCKLNNKLVPELPDTPSVTEDDIIAEMNIKDRNEYFLLEAKASVIGKYIHPNGALSNARKDLTVKINNPHLVERYGQSVTVTEYKPTIALCVVEDKFQQLQNTHRELSARLNAIKAQIINKVNERRLELFKKYREEADAAFKVLDEVKTEYSQWQIEESKRIAALKIVIPNALQSALEYLQNQGKETQNREE